MTDDYGNQIYVTHRELSHRLDDHYDALDAKIERVENRVAETREDVAVIRTQVETILSALTDRKQTKAAKVQASAQREVAWIGMVGAVIAALISSGAAIASIFAA